MPKTTPKQMHRLAEYQHLDAVNAALRTAVSVAKVSK
jgi:hypothetical protein